MKMYRKADNEIRDDDLVQATFKGKQYQGIVSESNPQIGYYYVSFDGYDQIQEQAYETNDRFLTQLAEWMEKDFKKSELKLLQQSTRWEEIKSPNNLDLVNPEDFTLYRSSWDVRAAKRLIHLNPRSVKQFRVTNVEYYVTRGQIAISDKYKQADLSIPLIMISDERGEDQAFPIDGWHRIKKALEEKVEYLPCYILTPEESKKIEL